MVQGKSKIIEEARSQEKNNKYLENEIKEELKRIYKIRGIKSDERLPRKISDHSTVLPPIKL